MIFGNEWDKNCDLLEAISEGFFEIFSLEEKLGRNFGAGAEGRKLVQGRLRAVAVGRLFLDAPLSNFFIFLTKFQAILEVISEVV